MNPTIYLEYINHCHFRLSSDDEGVKMEIHEYLSFFVDGYKWMPKYKNGMWSGKIHLYEMYRGSKIPCGLLNEVVKFCKSRNYKLVLKNNAYGTPQISHPIDKNRFKEFFKIPFSDNKGNPIKPYPYQVDGFIQALMDKRNISIIPTGGGKSLFIYMLVRWIMQELPEDKKILIVVPTTQLVDQIYKDFGDYSQNDPEWSHEDECHMIYSGKEKTTPKPVVISTWQSAVKFKKSFFLNVYGILGDEAHTFIARSLNTIMNSLVNCPWRIGDTGTLKGTKVNTLQLSGLFGPVRDIISTKELMDLGYLSQLDITAVVLKYPEELRKGLTKTKYADERKFVDTYKKRNTFIANLALKQKGNTLITIRHIHHGQALYEEIKKKAGKRKVFFVYGGTATEDRETVRQIVEKEKDAIIIASVVFLTGVNIKNLHNLIFASMTKSAINVFQSIGRSLRKADDGSTAKLFDIIDDLSWKKRKNFLLLHGIQRLKMYVERKLDYKYVEVEI